jgi:hypothetical protein
MYMTERITMSILLSKIRRVSSSELKEICDFLETQPAESHTALCGCMGLLTKEGVSVTADTFGDLAKMGAVYTGNHPK